MEAVKWFLKNNERWVRGMTTIGLKRQSNTNLCIEIPAIYIHQLQIHARILLEACYEMSILIEG